MTSWTSLPTEEAFITLRALGRVALTCTVSAGGDTVGSWGDSNNKAGQWGQGRQCPRQEDDNDNDETMTMTTEQQHKSKNSILYSAKIK